MAKETTNQRSPSTAAHLEVVCEGFKHFSKRTLIGFATLAFPIIGVRVVDCGVHVRENGDDRKMWISWPGLYRDGKWMSYLETVDRQSHFRFQAVAVRAVERFLDSLQSPARAQAPTKAPVGPPPAEIPDFPL